MKRSSQTEKKVFNSANGFEKRPAAKKMKRPLSSRQ